jgi:hypothetical protein
MGTRYAILLVNYDEADISDPRWHHVARVAKDVWGDGLVAYAETLRGNHGSEQEHRDFVRRVKLDMQNLDYQMIVSMYTPQLYCWTNNQACGYWAETSLS